MKISGCKTHCLAPSSTQQSSHRYYSVMRQLDELQPTFPGGVSPILFHHSWAFSESVWAPDNCLAEDLAEQMSGMFLTPRRENR